MLVRFTGFVTDRVSVWTDFTERETEKEIMGRFALHGFVVEIPGQSVT